MVLITFTEPPENEIPIFEFCENFRFTFHFLLFHKETNIFYIYTYI